MGNSEYLIVYQNAGKLFTHTTDDIDFAIKFVESIREKCPNSWLFDREADKKLAEIVVKLSC